MRKLTLHYAFSFYVGILTRRIPVFWGWRPVARIRFRVVLPRYTWYKNYNHGLGCCPLGDRYRRSRGRYGADRHRPRRLGERCKRQDIGLVIVASYGHHLKSLASRLFVEQLVRVTGKAPYNCAFVRFQSNWNSAGNSWHTSRCAMWYGFIFKWYED